MTHENIPTLITQNEDALLYRRAIRKLIRKLDLRILPFMVVLEISRFGFQVATSMRFTLLHPSQM